MRTFQAAITGVQLANALDMNDDPVVIDLKRKLAESFPAAIAKEVIKPPLSQVVSALHGFANAICCEVEEKEGGWVLTFGGPEDTLYLVPGDTVNKNDTAEMDTTTDYQVIV